MAITSNFHDVVNCIIHHLAKVSGVNMSLSRIVLSFGNQSWGGLGLEHIKGPSWFLCNFNNVS